ncbi:MAG: Fic family protein [Lachnospiraceae bacterium]
MKTEAVLKLLDAKRQECKNGIDILKTFPEQVKNYEDNFLVRYTYESTAIEGNTLNLKETRALILDNKTPNEKEMKEIFEQINHKKAFAYTANCVRKKMDLSEEIICNMHRQLVENIFPGGNYRQVEVYIQGAEHECPRLQELPKLLEEFYLELNHKNDVCGMPESNVHPFELACWTHTKFVGIHPFRDGNGRTSRLMMNYQLLKHDYLPISIPLDMRFEYYRALDECHCRGNIEPFINLMANIESKELSHMIEQTKLIQNLEREL